MAFVSLLLVMLSDVRHHSEKAKIGLKIGLLLTRLLLEKHSTLPLTNIKGFQAYFFLIDMSTRINEDFLARGYDSRPKNALMAADHG